MFAFQGHNQALYHLTQLTNGFRPKSSSFVVRVHQPISNAPEIFCLESFVEAKRNCTELPKVLKASDVPNILRPRSYDKQIKLEKLLELKNTKRTKKRNKWNVSYISGASFAENKKGFTKSADSLRIFSIKPLHGVLRAGHNSIFNVQIRDFRTQRTIKTNEESNASITSRIMKLLGSSEQNKLFGLNLKNQDYDGMKTVMHKDESPDDRMKLAFAEGYLEGRSRKAPLKLFEWIKTLQSCVVFGLTLFLIILFVYKFNSSDGRIFRIQFNDNVEVDAEMVHVTFSDVKGIDEAKKELQSLVEYLKNPAKFTALGGKLPKGVLLAGPPGTGKTLIARAVAGEAGVPFFQAAGSEFDEILVGQGAKRVRELFKAAKERAPCVIFLDEIDSVGSQRTNSVIHPYANQTINQLLSEMDGFHPNEGVIVLGATNRAGQLDPALMRPGRFDVQIQIGKPDLLGRKEMFKLYLSKIIFCDIEIEKLAKSTLGFTGADIANMVNQAALHAALLGHDQVNMKHLEYAKEKIMMGLGRKRIEDEEVNKITAYHESGHALVSYFSKSANSLYKVTILPRGYSLGHTSFLPKRDIGQYSKQELLSALDVCLGGRAAEELIFGSEKITIGASSDLKRANQIAENMVTKYGMTEKFGFRVFNGKQPNEMVDSEVRAILQQSYDRAKAILKTHQKELKLLAEALLKYETLDSEDVKNLLNGKKMKIETVQTPHKIDRNISEDVPVDVPKNVL